MSADPGDIFTALSAFIYACVWGGEDDLKAALVPVLKAHKHRLNQARRKN